MLGAGSIGGLWAAHLANAGFPVTLILKDDYALGVYQRTPLTLQDENGLGFPRIEAELTTGTEPIDWLLVSTKSFATLHAMEAIKHRISAGCRILLLQNGIGIQWKVEQIFPRAHVVAGVTTEAAYRRGRFQVIHAGRGHTRFGAVSTIPSAVVDDWRRLCRSIGLSAEWVDDIWPVLWHKVSVNCCINALTALRQCRNGELLESADLRRQIRGLVAEIQQVMRVGELGFSFPNLYDEVCEIIAATSQNYSSMCQDVERGRPTEIEHINGFICAQGKLTGVDTPLNRALVDALLPA